MVHRSRIKYIALVLCVTAWSSNTFAQSQATSQNIRISTRSIISAPAVSQDALSREGQSSRTTIIIDGLPIVQSSVRITDPQTREPFRFFSTCVSKSATTYTALLNSVKVALANVFVQWVFGKNVFVMSTVNEEVDAENVKSYCEMVCEMSPMVPSLRLQSENDNFLLMPDGMFSHTGDRLKDSVWSVPEGDSEIDRMQSAIDWVFSP